MVRRFENQNSLGETMGGDYEVSRELIKLYNEMVQRYQLILGNVRDDEIQLVYLTKRLKNRLQPEARQLLITRTNETVSRCLPLLIERLSDLAQGEPSEQSIDAAEILLEYTAELIEMGIES